MADTKISDLTEAIPDALDFLEFLDVSDTTFAATGSNRKAKLQALLQASPFGPNLLTNPDFFVNARGVTTYTSTTNPANNDATYLIDGWVLLAEANNTVDVGRSSGLSGVTSSPVGYYSCLMTIRTANNKFGQATFLEGKKAVPLVGLYLSLSFRSKVSNTRIGAIRTVLLAWTGTEDSPTKDVVSVWGAAGTNPTWVTSYTAVNTPADLTPAVGWTLHKIENLQVPSGTKNLVLFVWCDDKTTTIGDTLEIADINLHLGPVALPFRPNPPAQQTLDCQRFFFQLDDPDNAARYEGGRTEAITAASFTWPLPTPMRARPACTVYGSNVNVNDGLTAKAVTALGADYGSRVALSISMTTATGLTSGRPIFISMSDAVSGLRASAELGV